MNMDSLNKLSDAELMQIIDSAHGLLTAREEKRKSDAMEQIRQIAANAKIIVSFEHGRKPKSGKPALKAGDCYINPGNPAQSHTIGKGKPPQWFAALRDRNRLPPPIGSSA